MCFSACDTFSDINKLEQGKIICLGIKRNGDYESYRVEYFGKRPQQTKAVAKRL